MAGDRPPGKWCGDGRKPRCFEAVLKSWRKKNMWSVDFDKTIKPFCNRGEWFLANSVSLLGMCWETASVLKVWTSWKRATKSYKYRKYRHKHQYYISTFFCKKKVVGLERAVLACLGESCNVLQEYFVNQCNLNLIVNLRPERLLGGGHLKTAYFQSH